MMASAYAPAWGEFYELTGQDSLSSPQDWHEMASDGNRHFLFYFRDQTFECFAADWHFSRKPLIGLVEARSEDVAAGFVDNGD